MPKPNSFDPAKRRFAAHCSALVATLALGGAIAGWPATALAQAKRPAGTATVGTTVLVVGDSLSAEYGLTRGTGWVALLGQRLGEHRPTVRVVNASVSGDTTAGGRSRLPTLLKTHRPSHVVLELGGNDALRGLDLRMTQANLNAMAAAAIQAGARVTVVGMQVPPNYGSAYARDFSQVFANVARQHQAALVPFLLAGVADGPNPTALFQADRIHPNEQAQTQMLDNVWPVLKPQLP